MAIVKQNDVSTLIEGWLKDEMEGVQFPVPFDLVWQMAGYSDKGKGKRALTKENSSFVEGVDFAFTQKGKWSQEGRSSEIIMMTTDALKHFFMLARTEEGRQTRQYFIEVEKAFRAGIHENGALMLKLKELELEAAKINKEIAKTIKEIGLSENSSATFKLLGMSGKKQRVDGNELYRKIIQTKRGQTIDWHVVKSLSRGKGKTMLAKPECIKVMDSIAKSGFGQWVDKLRIRIFG